MKSAPDPRSKSVEDSYRSRAPAKGANARERLLYHLDRMVEFAWNANAYARVKASARQNRIAGLVKTDVFFCLQASAKLLGETITEVTGEHSPTGLRECWYALAALLHTLETRSGEVEDQIAQRVFLLFFVGALIMRRSFENSPYNPLREDELFSRGTFAIPDDQRKLLAGLPVSLFNAIRTSSMQLEAAALNFRSLDEVLQT
jgi:hypothetical protein